MAASVSGARGVRKLWRDSVPCVVADAVPERDHRWKRCRADPHRPRRLQKHGWPFGVRDERKSRR